MVLVYGDMAQSGTATDSKSVEPHFAVCGFKSRYLLKGISYTAEICTKTLIYQRFFVSHHVIKHLTRSQIGATLNLA